MKPTKNNPWAAMDAIVNANPEPTGAEWFTVEQYAKRYGCTGDAAYGRLCGMHEGGRVDRWTGTSAASRRTTTKWRAKAVS